MLRRAGFNVPPGMVVPADVLGRAADELPPGPRMALARVPELLGSGPWAVRSSSTAEDTEQASFAGQFETVLDVDAFGLADAVFRVWRSMASRRVKAYAGSRERGSMAILIQPMIPADAAGVAFSVDPVTGRHRTVIEAVEGLGERLVSGAATPERWAVEDDGSIEAPSGATVLDAEQARAIGSLARRVEEHFGCHQDIEWAIAGGSIWLLQARPITTMPSGPELIPIPSEVPPGYWERDTFHEPVPISPFGRVLLTEQILKVFPAAFADFGILLDRAENAFIGGWMYRQMIPLGAPPPGRGRAGQPPRWLLWLLMRAHPAIRRRTRAARQAIDTDLPATIIRRWTEEWRPQHQEEIARALAVDLGSLEDQELAAQLDHRIAIVGHPAHVVVGMAYWLLVYELAEACRDLLAWDTAKTLTLLEGLSTISTEPARQLAHLAHLARGKPAVRELLADVDETTPQRLAHADAEFARAFSDYVDANGRRALRYDVIEPTLAETPHVLLRLVADQLEIEFSSDKVAQEALRRRTEAADEARRVLASHPRADGERFEWALARAREAYPTLEDRVWWTFSVQTALLRYLALEIGGRLVERGRLAALEDVFFLEAQDARSALFDGVDRREAARLAKGQRAWATAHPGPYAYGERPAGPPPFELLPPPARRVNQGVLWGLAQVFGEPGDARDEGVVAGSTGIAWSIQRHGAHRHGRAAVQQDPGGRRRGLPDNVPGLVGGVPEHGRASHRWRRHPLPPGDHRPGARHPGDRRYRPRNVSPAGWPAGDCRRQYWRGRDRGFGRSAGIGCRTAGRNRLLRKGSERCVPCGPMHAPRSPRLPPA